VLLLLQPVKENCSKYLRQTVCLVCSSNCELVHRQFDYKHQTFVFEMLPSKFTKRRESENYFIPAAVFLFLIIQNVLFLLVPGLSCWLPEKAGCVEFLFVSVVL
jgi:hypothetical protein